MDNDRNYKKEKFKQIQDILRLHFIESATFNEITEKIGVSRPTARKYIDKFKEMVSHEDFSILDTYKESKRRVPFPTCWNKYVKKMVDSHARHPKRVATPAMRKKIIQTATANLSSDAEYRSALDVYNLLIKSEDKSPSYETVAKVIREHFKKGNPSTE